jgi:DNA-binding transcriptional MerR regulator
MTEIGQKKREPWRKYAERRGVSTRTLDRWVEDGILDPPEKINGRKYTSPDAEPRRDDELPLEAA